MAIPAAQQHLQCLKVIVDSLTTYVPNPDVKIVSKQEMEANSEVLASELQDDITHYEEATQRFPELYKDYEQTVEQYKVAQEPVHTK